MIVCEDREDVVDKKREFGTVDEDGVSLFSREYMVKHGIVNGHDPRLFGKPNVQRILDSIGEDAGLVVYRSKDDPKVIFNVDFCAYVKRFQTNVRLLDEAEKPFDVMVLASIDEVMEAIDDKHALEDGMDETAEEMAQFKLRMILMLRHVEIARDAIGEDKNIGRDDVLEASLRMDSGGGSAYPYD